jgi:protein-S-isoprenylcysteine O-methyltransferase
MQLVDVVGLSILAVELAFFTHRRSDSSVDRSHDGRSLRILWRSILAGVLAAHALRWFHVGPEFALGEIGGTIAVSTVVAGLAIRVWAVVVLGRHFTVDVAIRSGHELVVSGPFRFVRHPSYTGLVLMFAGWAITFENQAAIVVLMAPLSIALAYRMRVEEDALAGAFGGAYAAYRARTKRLFPLIY